MNKRAVLKYRVWTKPLDQQSNALPLSYIPMNMVTNNTDYITLFTYEQISPRIW